eukprot:4751306-Pyramimonas_sp.AAC.1
MFSLIRPAPRHAGPAFCWRQSNLDCSSNCRALSAHLGGVAALPKFEVPRHPSLTASLLAPLHSARWASSSPVGARARRGQAAAAGLAAVAGRSIALAHDGILPPL